MARKKFKESEIGFSKRKFRKAPLDMLRKNLDREFDKFISANKFTEKHLEDVFTFKKMQLKLVGAQDSNYFVFENIEDGYHYIIDRRQVQDYFLTQVDPDHKANWVNEKYDGGSF